MSLTNQQIQAIEENGKNIIVSAGAGSGKTKVLTERVFDRISNKKYKWNIDELLVLTFTNAAAANMKSRIRNKLLLNENNCLSVEEQYKQLNKIDSSYIMTFDAYALFLIKKYHQVLGVDEDVKIIDTNIIKNKTYEFIDEIFINEYKNQNKEFINLVNDFCVKDDYILRESVIKINQKLNSIYDRETYINEYRNNYYSDKSIEKVFEKYESIIINRIKIINELLNELSNYVENYNDYFVGIEELINSKSYEEIRNINIDHSKQMRGQGEEAKLIKAEIVKHINEIEKMCYFSKNELIEQIKNTQNNALYLLYLAEELNKKLSNYKKINNEYEYSDIFVMAINLVDKYENINKEIKESFKEILIDEYQDTNDLQDEFIKRIEKNNVYMVGDVKQSIYRFRNANPSIFIEKYDKYENTNDGVALKLTSNFRSRKEVLEFIDDVFERIMDKKIGGADYKKDHQMICGNNDYNEKGRFDNQSNKAEIISYIYSNETRHSYPFDQLDQSEVEAFIIAKDIKEKIESGFKVTYIDKQIDELGNEKEVFSSRPIEYKDFTILVDRGTNFEVIKQILTSCGIPSDIHSDEKMDGSDLITVIRAIFKLICCIKNNDFDYDFKFAYMSLARSFLVEMDDSELYQIVTTNNYDETQLYNKAIKIVENIEIKTIANILDEFINVFDVYDKLSRIGDIHENMVRIDYLYKLADSLNKSGYDYTNFNDYLITIFDSNSEDTITYKTQKDNQNAVTITNIHQSKGLEYSVCYYPLLTVGFNKQDIKESIIFDKNNGLIIPSMIKNKGLKQTIVKDVYKQEYIINDISERIRLFYVALTRAKEKIVLVCPIENKTKDGQIISDENRLTINCYKDMLDMIYDDLEKYIKQIDLNNYKDIINVDYQLSNKDIFMLIPKTNKQISVKNRIEILPKQIDKTSYSKESGLVSKELAKKLDLGSKVHHYLEMLDFNNPNYDLIDVEYSSLIKEFLASEIMVNRSKAKIYKEYEFMYLDDNEKKHGFIDLLMEYDDHFDIIDYKTKNIDDEHYDEQLRGYRKYIQTISDKKINCYLYSIIDGVYRKVE